MSLAPGSRIGAYEIQSALGAGGMGEVYRARDTKLGRQVAVKILPDDFLEDPARVARFQREAQALAALNHPHIAQIYGFDDSSAIHALVIVWLNRDGEPLGTIGEETDQTDVQLAPDGTREPLASWTPSDEAATFGFTISSAVRCGPDFVRRGRRLDLGLVA